MGRWIRSTCGQIQAWGLVVLGLSGVMILIDVLESYPVSERLRDLILSAGSNYLVCRYLSGHDMIRDLIASR